MEKVDFSPTWAASRRRIRTQAEWKVDTHIALARAPDQRGDPLAHLGRGLVGEGDGQDLAGVDVAGGQQVGDPVGQHAGLARARAGDDEQRLTLVDHRGSRCWGLRPCEQHLGVARQRGTGAASGVLGRLAAGLGPGGDPARVHVATRLRGGHAGQGKVIEKGAHLGSPAYVLERTPPGCRPHLGSRA